MSRRPAVRLPRARRPEELIIEQVADEVLVFDNATMKAHRLNRTAALVWRHCDGKTSIDAVQAALRKAELPDDAQVVELAIAELAKAKLVEPIVDWSTVQLRSRRRFLQAALKVALVLPIVQTMSAPARAQAASCLGRGTTCVGFGQQNCCAGLRCRRTGPRRTCR